MSKGKDKEKKKWQKFHILQVRKTWIYFEIASQSVLREINEGKLGDENRRGEEKYKS